MSERETIEYPALKMPDSVVREKVTIWSLGVALDGDIYKPKNLASDQKCPAIVLSHGWGGDKNTAERYAALFASCGMIALCFTYSSWGESGGTLVPVGPVGDLDESNEVNVRVRVIRELLDPLDWVQNYRSAVDFIEGEPNVDIERIGAWGTSYGGGIVVSAASEDQRIKAISVQVPMLFNPPEPFLPLIKERSIQIARGDIDPIPQGTDEFPGMAGTPHYSRMGQHRPGDKLEHIAVPMLILDAANEEFFDIVESGEAAFNGLKSRGVEAYYEVLPDIDHYGIYFGGYDRGSELAKEWLKKHL